MNPTDERTPFETVQEQLIRQLQFTFGVEGIEIPRERAINAMKQALVEEPIDWKELEEQWDLIKKIHANDLPPVLRGKVK